MQGRRRVSYLVVTVVVLALIGWLTVRYLGKRQLVHTLSSNDLKDRTAAAAKLLEMGKLSDTLPAQPIIVRSKTAQALGGIGSGEAIKVLGELLKDQEEAPRRWARQALVKQGMRSLPVLLAALSASGGTRDEAITALKQIGPSAADSVRFFLTDGSAYEGACIALGYLGDPGIGALLKASLAPDGDLRANALSNLGLRRVKAAVGPSLENLGKDPNAQKGAAIKALGLIGDHAAVPALIPFLQDKDNREAAVSSLGMLGDARAVEPIAGTLAVTDARYRNAAILSLRRIGAPAFGALVRELKSADPTMREAAAQALIGSSSASLNGPLMAALQDPAEPVRAAAAQALGWEGNTAALPALVAALSDPGWPVADASVGAIGEIGANAAGTLLSALRTTNDQTVSYHIARSLAAMGRAAVPRLTAALADPSPPAQKWSAVALGQIGDQRASSALRQLATSANPEIRWVAEEQLRKMQISSGS